MFEEIVSNYEPQIFEDKRGYLKVISEDQVTGVSYKESFSLKNVYRGLHIQFPPHVQTKHIMVKSGCIIDYVMVLDPKRKDFGQIFNSELSSSEKIYTIPKFCAHGYLALEDSVIRYLCLGKYSEKEEVSINFNEGVDDNLIRSVKDENGLTLEEAVQLFSKIQW